MFCGEITVFLSMILFLILALVGTKLEAARINIGKSYADRSLQNAVNNLFTEYCIRLWEDYHVFFIEGEKTETEDEDYIKSRIRYYISNTFEKEKSMKNEMDLLDMETGQIEIENIMHTMDSDGEFLLNQILEYSKYNVSEEFLL